MAVGGIIYFRQIRMCGKNNTGSFAVIDANESKIVNTYCSAGSLEVTGCKVIIGVLLHRQ